MTTNKEKERMQLIYLASMSIITLVAVAIAFVNYYFGPM